MLEAVIFDMDGVIVDSHPAHREAWRMFMRTLGKSVSDADLDFVLDGRKRGEILRHFLGELSEAAMQEYGKRKDEYFREASLQVKPVPGVVKFMRTLEKAGVAMAVATSASESRTRHTLEHLRLISKVRVIVTGDDVALGKPDPSIYVLACEQLSVNPGNAVAIEDAVSGIQAARGAGLNCIGVASHQSPDKLHAAGAALVIRDFSKFSLRRLERCLLDRGTGRSRSIAACAIEPSLSS
jgi:HAD superfamily hydrolase (TIGR01509 family)